MKYCLLVLASATLIATGRGQALPSAFDLRNVGGTNYSTSVKDQNGGTCWTHGTMAAMESNLRLTGVWEQNGETGEPNLAEYHLDWWNGFNQHNNDDIDPPTGDGLEVHLGGDYRVASAYMIRGDGAVRESDGKSYASPPDRQLETYHYYYPRHVEWYVDDQTPDGRDAIKRAIMEHGAIGTCMYWGGGFFSSTTDSHYQPPTDINAPNHSVAIIGWNDTKETQSATNGAWMCKNSWGEGWSEDGHFWIAYDDKHCCKEPQMGAVSFRDVVRQAYLNIYYHDTHGWRDTLATNSGMNAFVAQENEDLVAVSFFTASTNVEYAVEIYRQFTGGQCSDLASIQTGLFEHSGFHTVDLETKVYLATNQPFYVVLELSHGGQAYDRTSEVPVLLGTDAPDPAAQSFEAYLEDMGKMNAGALAGTKVTVTSSATTNESFYRSNGPWIDLTTFDSTANFCIKALSAVPPDWDGDGIPDGGDPDDDNDGLPDIWENQFGFNPCDPTDRDIDPDLDGWSNWKEWIADTNPTNPASILHIAIESNIASTVSVHFDSSAQRHYTLLGSDNLQPAEWIPVPDAGPRAGVGGPDQMTDPAPEMQRFYRIRVEVPQ